MFSDEPAIKKFNFHRADRIYSRGGSTLIMSRHKPKDDEFRPDFFKKNNVKLLVTIGGDDYKEASQYVANPEDYDIKKILNWI